VGGHPVRRLRLRPEVLMDVMCRCGHAEVDHADCYCLVSPLNAQRCCETCRCPQFIPRDDGEAFEVLAALHCAGLLTAPMPPVT
jgi:hypothetical protein